MRPFVNIILLSNLKLSFLYFQQLVCCDHEVGNFKRANITKYIRLTVDIMHSLLPYSLYALTSSITVTKKDKSYAWQGLFNLGSPPKLCQAMLPCHSADLPPGYDFLITRGFIIKLKTHVGNEFEPDNVKYLIENGNSLTGSKCQNLQT